MTPSEQTALIDKHLASWLGSDTGPDLRERIAAMLAECEATRDKLWSDGNATLRHERDEAIAARKNDWKMHDEIVEGQAKEIRENLLTIAVLRKEVRVLVDQRAAISVARDDAVAAAHLAVEEGVPKLLEQVQQQIDEIKPGLGRDQCKDDYEHGHRNGMFFVLVELRRAIKEDGA